MLDAIIDAFCLDNVEDKLAFMFQPLLAGPQKRYFFLLHTEVFSNNNLMKWPMEMLSGALTKLLPK